MKRCLRQRERERQILYTYISSMLSEDENSFDMQINVRMGKSWLKPTILFPKHDFRVKYLYVQRLNSETSIPKIQTLISTELLMKCMTLMLEIKKNSTRIQKNIDFHFWMSRRVNINIKLMPFAVVMMMMMMMMTTTTSHVDDEQTYFCF
jgi:hypothetical protein